MEEIHSLPARARIDQHNRLRRAELRARRGWIVLAVAIALSALGAAIGVGAESAANKLANKPANEPIAYTLWGGNSATAPAGQGILDLRAWAADLGPRVARHKIKRVWLHNPGGIWPGVDAADAREMRVDQWLLAEKAGLAFADRRALRQAFAVLRRHGVREIIVYVGSPTQLMDAERELPRCVEPFLDAGPGVSIGLDAVFHDGHPATEKTWRAQWAPNSPYVCALVELRRRLHAQGGKLYSEPRLTREQLAAGLGRLVDGTVAAARYDEGPQYAVELEIQPGETIRLTHPLTEAQWRAAPWWPEVPTWPAGVTPLYRSDFNWGPLQDAYVTPKEFPWGVVK